MPENQDPDSVSSSWEEEARRKYGSPEERREKNRRHVRHLVRLVPEAEIREILKALSRMGEPMCCSRLRELDLANMPLEDLIQPYELFGFRFHVSSFKGNQLTVHVGESYGTVGSGGSFKLEHQEDGTYKVLEGGIIWIA